MDAARINISGCSVLTKTKIELYIRSFPAIQFFFTEKPDFKKKYSVYILNTAAFKTLPESFAILNPVILYGPHEYISAAMSAGAADYLCEPWTPDELTARCGKLLDREKLYLTGWELHLKPSGFIHLNNKELRQSCRIFLSKSERTVLRMLLMYRGTFLNRDLLNSALNTRVNGSRAADMAVSRLRSKLGDYCKSEDFILTSTHAGWCIPAASHMDVH